MPRLALFPSRAQFEGKEHGTRIKYLTGCKCEPCREANSAYSSARRIARDAGDWNGYISVDAARTHLEVLDGEGMGMHKVSRACGIHPAQLYRIKNGEQRSIRAILSRRILAVTPAQKVLAFPSPQQTL